MLYAKTKSGEMVPITYSNTYAKCPACGVFHQIDLSEMMECAGGDVEDVTAYCEECSKKHMPMWERMDEIEDVAAKFPDTKAEQVMAIVRSGIDHGFFFETALVGARLALAIHTGREQLFSLNEVASALGCTREEAAAEMERLGISPIKASALPGFEWALGQEA